MMLTTVAEQDQHSLQAPRAGAEKWKQQVGEALILQFLSVL